MARGDLLRNIFGGGGNPVATVISDTVTKTFSGVVAALDSVTLDKEERAAFKITLLELEAKERRDAMEKDAAILMDRQSARGMAGVHGETQRKVAILFIRVYFVVLALDFAFVGLMVYLALGNPDFNLPQWVVGLIGTTLGSTTTAMSLKLDTILGFLFGGSAGGDDSTARLTESLREANTTQPQE